MKEQADNFKKEVLAIGDELQGFIYAKIDNTGRVMWRRGGGLQDSCMLLSLLQARVQDELNLMFKAPEK